ncbi:MAG: FAD-binding protein [Acidimicrobiales bacterium]
MSHSRQQLMSGWGRSPGSASHLLRIGSEDDLVSAVSASSHAKTPLLARGLGRAYGDAAQCGGGTVLDMTGLDRVISFDPDTGVLRCEAGISLDSLLCYLVPHGWFLPVTPGTRQVTIGGAVAADVHGKNHHRDGSFARYVRGLTLVNTLGTLKVSPVDDPEIFWATVGGMGLTGVIADVTLSLQRIASTMMSVDTRRTCDLEETMTLLSDSDENYHYSVAWVDGVARGRHLGRSVITQAEHVSRVKGARQGLDAYRPQRAVNVRVDPPVNVVVPSAVEFANRLFFRRASVQRQEELQTLGRFFYPLDAVQNWNRLYGQRGFTQYQFAVSFGEEETVRKVLESLHRARVTPTLVVLKRFGPSNEAPLSFPMPGWTLALDLALGAREVAPALDELDELIATALGRVYLAKDGRLRPEMLEVMYPRVGAWRKVRRRVDPEGIFVSDLSRRLGLHGD